MIFNGKNLNFLKILFNQGPGYYRNTVTNLKDIFNLHCGCKALAGPGYSQKYYQKGVAVVNLLQKKYFIAYIVTTQTL